jgi:hypothetical protein
MRLTKRCAGETRLDRSGKVVRIVRWTAGVLWALSWIELYLEIYRHHHVAPSFLAVAPAPEIRPGSHPGAWLLTDLTVSAAAPLVFGIAVLWRRKTRTSGAKPRDKAGLAWGMIIVGTLLAVFGTLNQVIQAAPLEMDLTLRHGSGGFIVDGLILVLAGAAIRWTTVGRRRRRYGNRRSREPQNQS